MELHRLIGRISGGVERGLVGCERSKRLVVGGKPPAIGELDPLTAVREITEKVFRFDGDGPDTR